MTHCIHVVTDRQQVDDEGGFIKFFKALPDADEDTVRIFDRGDFYTAHGDDATFIARTVRTSSVNTPVVHKLSWTQQ